MSIMRVWAGLACVVCASGAFGAEPRARLRPIFVEGETSSYGYSETSALTNESVALKHGSNTQKLVYEMKFSLKVARADESGATVELTLDRLRFSGTNPTAKELPSFDTGAPAEEAATNPYAPAMLPLVGKMLTVRVLPDGGIARISAPAVELPDLKFVGVAKQFISPEWLRPRLEPIFSMHAPSDSVVVSTTWSSPGEVESILGIDQPIKVKTDYKVESVEENQVKLSTTGWGELGELRSGQDVKAKLVSFDSRGNAAWDTKDGALMAWRTDATWVLTTTPAENLHTRAITETTVVMARLK